MAVSPEHILQGPLSYYLLVSLLGPHPALPWAPFWDSQPSALLHGSHFPQRLPGPPAASLATSGDCRKTRWARP